mmetsp:Transcript_17023/g.46655  ORF Transcript_17023/g.46655 Transcript_17023/m.46655 type:complete len:113 (-) Transcript_17023:59-397(-)
MKSLTPAVLWPMSLPRLTRPMTEEFPRRNCGIFSIVTVVMEMSFNALWAVLDTRGTGQVDFLECCAFFSDCQDEYDEARRNNPTNRKSVRQSLAISLTAKFQEVSKAMEPFP